MSNSYILWIAFNAFVLGMLALDLGVFQVGYFLARSMNVK